MFHLLSKVAPYLHFLYGSLFALLTVVFVNLLPPTTTGGLLVAVSSSEVHRVHPNSKTIGTLIRGQHYAGAAVALTAIWLITVLGGSTCALRSAYPPSFSLPHIFLHCPVVTYQGKVRTLTALHILVCAQSMLCTWLATIFGAVETRDSFVSRVLYGWYMLAQSLQFILAVGDWH